MKRYSILFVAGLALMAACQQPAEESFVQDPAEEPAVFEAYASSRIGTRSHFDGDDEGTSKEGTLYWDETDKVGVMSVFWMDIKDYDAPPFSSGWTEKFDRHVQELGEGYGNDTYIGAPLKKYFQSDLATVEVNSEDANMARLHTTKPVSQWLMNVDEVVDIGLYDFAMIYPMSSAPVGLALCKDSSGDVIFGVPLRVEPEQLVSKKFGHYQICADSGIDELKYFIGTFGCYNSEDLLHGTKIEFDDVNPLTSLLEFDIKSDSATPVQISYLKIRTEDVPLAGDTYFASEGQSKFLIFSQWGEDGKSTSKEITLRFPEVTEITSSYSDEKYHAVVFPSYKNGIEVFYNDGSFEDSHAHCEYVQEYGGETLYFEAYDASDNLVLTAQKTIPENGFRAGRRYKFSLDMTEGGATPDYVYDIQADKEDGTAYSFDAAGDALDGNIQIKSIKTYGETDEEREANAVPAAWKTQIQVDTDADGTPDSWIDLADATAAQRPAWMPADFPTGGTPEGTGFYEVPAVKMTAQPVMSHEERLRTAWTEEIAAAHRNPSNRFDEPRLDLSKWNFVSHRLENRTTANCYIVQGPGKYMFPMVYGNAVDLICYNTADNQSSYEPSVSGAGVLNQFRNHVRNATDYEWTMTPYRIKQPWVSRDDNFGANCTEVGILWQDMDGTVITNLTTVDEFTYANGKADRFVCFDIPAETIKPGNVVIYVKDTGLTEESGSGHPVAWSWHIWITDQNMFPVRMKNNSNSAGFPVQPVNLGWVDGEEGLYYPARTGQVRFVAADSADDFADVELTQDEYEKMSTSGHAPFYQWGRKDPLQSTATAVIDELHHVYYSIRHPEVFLGQHTSTISQFDWTDNGYRNLWKSENKKYGRTDRTATTGRKTVYDPCPRGYVMAPGTTWDDVHKTGSEWTGSGWIIPSGMNDGRKTYLPAAGYLRVENPSGVTSASYLGLQNSGSKGYYWTDFPSSIGVHRQSFALKFESSESSFEVNDKMMRAYGCSVRCVREDRFTDDKEGGEAPAYVDDQPETLDEDNSYEIAFVTGKTLKTVINNTVLGVVYHDDADEIVLHESQQFVLEKPFTVIPAETAWFGSSDENLRYQVNLEAGTTLSIALSAKGQVAAKQIKVNCLSSESGATLDVNGLGAQSIYNAGESTLVTYDINPASTITSISLTASKLTAIYSITVEF